METMIATSPDVEAILRRACADCHSNETYWPWYSFVAPTSWFVVGHVDNGRLSPICRRGCGRERSRWID
jgi:hypothetical protein